jgi:hypothetical protein
MSEYCSALIDARLGGIDHSALSASDRILLDLVHSQSWTVDGREKALAQELDRLSAEIDRLRENPEHEPRALGQVAAQVAAAQNQLYQARHAFRVILGTAATILR